MNQRTVIYIILSAILLYLYYKKHDIAIFAVFVVVVGSTLIFRNGSTSEGFGLGGGGKVDSACAKMGFKEPVIKKDDLVGSLEKVTKNIEKVAEKYWRFVEKGDIEGKRTEDKTLEKSWNTIKETTYMKSLLDGMNKGDAEILSVLFNPAYEIYEKFIIKKLTNDEKDKFLKEKIMTKLDETIKGSAPVLEILKKLKNSDEMKDADDDAKNLLNYIICLANNWASIFKALKKAKGSDDDGDEEEKPKKKKTTKKTKKEEDAGDDE